ncbi:MAG: hypothetical protein EKK55_17290 [Rhodocyclaceae bacterium]|nr:MAG: hypothetical protein EKK55_17290 [Rhodocyclaceae bacterium]
MTEREPFAKPYKDEDIVAIVVGDGSFGPHFDKEESIKLANFLSVAHDARVKEECRKAVEEFRERAVQNIKKFGELMAKDDWNKRVGASDLFEQISFDIAELVATLPTEPEGK